MASKVRVHTYHCAYCSNLLLAATRDLSKLPRRAAPGLDKAIIVPMPPPPQRSESVASDSGEDNDGDGASKEHSKDGSGQKDITLLLCTKDSKPKVIVREDGFEKRWLWKCGRCKVVMGYQLDAIHYPSEESTVPADRSTPTPKREELIYVLPEALVSTEDLGVREPTVDKPKV